MSQFYDLLDRVEYRRIHSSEDMEQIGRLRAKTYGAYNVLPVKGGSLIDDIDFDPHAFVFGIYLDEQLISTIRVHHVTPSHRVSPSGQVRPREIDELLDSGQTLIDSSRLATDFEVVRGIPGANMLTMRLTVVATAYFDTDLCLSLIKPHHAPFYKRLFRFHTIMAPQLDDSYYKSEVTLVGLYCRRMRNWINSRYPFMQAQQCEMRMLFGDLDDLPFAPLTILPTARFAARLSTAA